MEIIVAEDEERQRDGIVNIIRYIDSGIRCTAFGDGAEVMEYLERIRYRADALFTDINMPDLDGLELIRQVGMRNRNLLVVIISGYASFEYAQQAVRLGAFRYLLKPVDPVEIETVLGEIKQRGADRKGVERGEDLWMEAHRRELLERQLNRWVEGRLRPEEVEKLPAIFRTRESGSLVFSTFTPAAAFQDGDNRIGTLLMRELRELLSPRYKCYSFLRDGSGLEMVTVVRRRPGAPASGSRELLEQWQGNLNAHYGIRCSTYWGEWTDRLSEHIAVQFRKDAALHRYWGFVTGGPVVLAEEAPREPDRREQAEAGDLATALKAEDKEQARAALQLAAGGFAREVPALKKGFAELGEKVCAALAPGGAELGRLQAQMVREEIERAGTLDELTERMYALLRELIAMTTSGGKSGQQQLYYMKIRAYLSHNYHRELTLEETAGHFRLNPSYFSSLVKSVSGRGFNALLTDIRLNRACELLAQTDHRVGEVGAMVGYPDPSYFGRVFKKGMGRTPEAYRKSEGRNGG